MERCNLLKTHFRNVPLTWHSVVVQNFDQPHAKNAAVTAILPRAKKSQHTAIEWQNEGRIQQLFVVRSRRSTSAFGLNCLLMLATHQK